jgi:hypothetical protein
MAAHQASLPTSGAQAATKANTANKLNNFITLIQFTVASHHLP